ncbi:3-hydroxyacyl-CoA dehydrogenase NAD-binding domain-containing protein [Chryseomicrobium sp. FSL W7-1435]|uniref:3-hydroxyacyl-CoA dehydrogenase NAD-binding domain-containing protein n=1 Tax=Chryseomicrobium sp. FSL W7-1435 TaxID=2921704 RepID=UPI00315AC520
MTIKSITVVGAGTIGLSWASLFLSHGHHVTLTDIREDLETVWIRHHESVQTTLESLGLPTSYSKDVLRFTNNLKEALVDADWVQENGPENREFKQQLYQQMERFAPAHTLFFSSSSTLPASEISANMEDASRVAIGHPFNPPLVMPLVEVVAGEKTAPQTIDQAMKFYQSLGKKPQLIKKEVFGFVANRLQFALLREAMHLADEGVVTMAEMDEIVKDSIGLRWAVTGPMLGMHLGGGEGGMAAFVKHLGPTMEKTWAAQGNPLMDEETRQRLAALAFESYGSTSIEELAKWRDKQQLSILQSRKN